MLAEATAVKGYIGPPQAENFEVWVLEAGILVLFFRDTEVSLARKTIGKLILKHLSPPKNPPAAGLFLCT